MKFSIIMTFHYFLNHTAIYIEYYIFIYCFLLKKKKCFTTFRIFVKCNNSFKNLTIDSKYLQTILRKWEILHLSS